MIGPRRDILARQHLEPADFDEQFVALANDLPLTAEQRDLVRERLGNVHLAAADPEGRVGALVGVIVEDDEVADALIIEADAGVRSEEHTSELQSLMRISYAVF